MCLGRILTWRTTDVWNLPLVIGYEAKGGLLQLLVDAMMTFTVLVTVASPNSNRAPHECRLEALPLQPNC